MAGAAELIARAGRHGLTFIARLKHAPFPIEDGEDDFFDGRDRKTGERFHSGPDGPLPEPRHFRDDRVLFHVPRQFDPARPFALIVYFHGHRTELRRTLLGEHDLARQADESGANVVLVAPQMALDAADSHPGKLAEPEGLDRFLDEAARVLAREAGMERAAVARAPVILAGFSGGYRGVAYCLERGGADRRVQGVVLLDAIYGEVERLRAWISVAGRHAFFLCLYGESSRDGTERLAAALAEEGIPVAARYPERLAPGAVHLVPVDTPHDRIPLDGPPARPLADILRRLPSFL
ncbi:MAG: alpha/beta hydrolase [Candidatus Eiseniibacteriota bacterium]